MNNLTATILLLASLGLFFGYINPAYRKETGSDAVEKKSVRELTTERAEYRAALQKTREIELARIGLLAKYNGIAAANREKLERMLPDHSDTVRLVIDINTIAAAHGVTLRNITVVDGVSGGASARAGAIGPSEKLYETIELAFGIRGAYEDIRSFLEDIEKNLRVIDPVSVGFAAPQGEAYDVSMTVRTYRLK